MRRTKRTWIRTGVVLACLAFAAVSIGCGSSSTKPDTGINVFNNATAASTLPNTHHIVRVDIGGTPAIVNIAPGQTHFMPTAPGNHTVDVVYDNATFATLQNPPDPVVVLNEQVVFVDFQY